MKPSGRENREGERKKGKQMVYGEKEENKRWFE